MICFKAQKNIMTLHALKGAEKYTKTVSQSDFKELLTVSKGLLKSVKFNASTFVEIRSLFAIEFSFLVLLVISQ